MKPSSELQHASLSGSTNFHQQLMIWRFIDQNVSIGYADINQEPKQISIDGQWNTKYVFDRFGRHHSCVCCTKQQPGGEGTVVAGTAGSVLGETRQTGFLFLVSCQIVAMIGPSPVIFCHCLNSLGLSFSFRTTGSPLLGFLFAICLGRFFAFRFTVPQPKSFHLSI